MPWSRAMRIEGGSYCIAVLRHPDRRVVAIRSQMDQKTRCVFGEVVTLHFSSPWPARLPKALVRALAHSKPPYKQGDDSRDTGNAEKSNPDPERSTVGVCGITGSSAESTTVLHD